MVSTKTKHGNAVIVCGRSFRNL